MKNIFKISVITAALIFSNSVFAEDTKTTTTETHKEVATKNVSAKDAKITKNVKANIQKHQMIAPLAIEVMTQDGVVTLVGNVDSDSQADLLISVAQATPKVEDVDGSKLVIKDSQHPFADTLTTARIKGLLIREDLFGDKDLSAMGTSVETKDGVVYLTGKTENKKQIENAIALIKKHIPGVKKVEYNVRVEPKTDTDKMKDTEKSKS